MPTLIKPKATGEKYTEDEPTTPLTMPAYIDLSSGHRIWDTIVIDDWGFNRAFRVLEDTESLRRH